MTRPAATLILEGTDIGGAAMDRSELLRQLETLHPDSFGWSLVCCRGDREEAEDVLHSAYEAVLDGRARYDGHSALKTWLYGVIRLTAVAHRRRRLTRWLRWERPLDGREAAAPTIDPTIEIVRSETVARLASALARLPRRQRELIHLVFYQELSIREAAELLGIGLGSARTHYERGKARLRELLEKAD